MMKRTPLYRKHVEAGAKIIPFAGYEMPVQYSGVLEEHRAVRNHAGLFDVSHMGELEVSGPDALSFVQQVTTNDAAKLVPGMVQYSAFCDDQGGIIDDLLVYRRTDRYMLVVNGANTAGNISWLNSRISGSVFLRDVSDETALLALQGPASAEILQKLTPNDLSPLRYYRFLETSVCGTDMLVSRTGYSGELGYELYFPANSGPAEELWDQIMEAGKDHGLLPAGLGARDTLRMEMGFCLYGNDIDRTTNPYEAGLGWITKPDKGDFIGRAALMKVKESGTGRKLAGFVLSEKGVPRKGYTILRDSLEIGTVTSGTFSPTLEQGIGMGYISVDHARPGTPVQILIRDRRIPGRVVEVPFVRKKRN